MEVEILGQGEPEHAVIGLIHGDEPCGSEAIERFKRSDYSVKKPVKLILANEKAAEKGVRYIDCDLNRNFPGDKESSKHEEKLAAEILEEVKGLEILSLHSTKSYSNPFAAQSILDKEDIEMIKDTGVRLVSFMENPINCLGEYSKAVTVECGFQGSDNAAKNGYRVLINFLAANNVIDVEYRRSEPDMFKVFETIEKPDYEFTAANFQKVQKGEVYARRNGEELVAKEDFYPVLMSTNGYDTILGHKAKKIDKKRYLKLLLFGE